MVQLMNSNNFRSESDRSTFFVKSEIEEEEEEDFLYEEHGPFHKRSKFQQQWNMGHRPAQSPALFNPLEEPSPLGLRLRKSPSLLELIQARISQENPSGLGGTGGEKSGRRQGGRKQRVKDPAAAVASNANDKLKASNFPGSLLRIGTWEYLSRYEGDLVAKCYFAKHKLVWEVLDGGLKNKIEIQWSDITGLKANFSGDGPESLEIHLSRQPLFFRETNPQPRKHTLWQATSDFTDHQASIHRRHFLECKQGLLWKHFEKLIQCDPRLNLLSQQPGIVSNSPYFEPKGSCFDEPSETQFDGFDQQKSPIHGFLDAPSPSASLSSSSKSELWDLPVDRAPEYMSREYTSPSSVTDSQEIEESGRTEFGKSIGQNHWDQFNVPGLHPSMSMSDLVNHIEHHISEQMTSNDPLVVGEGQQNKEMLDQITQHLLTDSQFASVSDEKLMPRVKSLCCLLQKDSTPQNKVTGDLDDHDRESLRIPEFEQASVMKKKDSFSDLLLLNLPRIASVPHLFDMGEDGENQWRS